MKRTTVVKTISGSVYEVDEGNCCVRRLGGVNDPTRRQGNDGEWRTFVELMLVGVPPQISMFFDWDGEGHGTMTSFITEYIDPDGNTEAAPWLEKREAN